MLDLRSLFSKVLFMGTTDFYQNSFSIKYEIEIEDLNRYFIKFYPN